MAQSGSTQVSGAANVMAPVVVSCATTYAWHAALSVLSCGNRKLKLAVNLSTAQRHDVAHFSA